MCKRILLSLLLGGCVLSADSLLMRNGQRIDGSYVGGDSRSIRFAVGNQINTYSLSDVDSIHFDSANPADSSAYNAPAPPVAQSRPPDGYGPAPSAPLQTSAPTSIEIPAGTQVVVRLIDDVNSERDSLGQTYRASIDQPVIVNGQTAIPRGSDVIAALVDAQKSGKIEGRTVMTLDLRSVSVNGRTSNITTTGVSQASSSRGQRSAKLIGGTAALGAIIGGIAGGGKGAAVGAGSGAAVGTAAEVATSGQKVRIPSETRLTFTLQNPLDL